MNSITILPSLGDLGTKITLKPAKPENKISPFGVEHPVKVQVITFDEELPIPGEWHLIEWTNKHLVYKLGRKYD